MIPAQSYINETTAAAAKAGKLLGTAGSFLIPMTAVARGAQALSKLGGAGKLAGGVLKYGTGPGLASQVKQAGARLAAPVAKGMGATGGWLDDALAAPAKTAQILSANSQATRHCAFSLHTLSHGTVMNSTSSEGTNNLLKSKANVNELY